MYKRALALQKNVLMLDIQCRCLYLILQYINTFEYERKKIENTFCVL